MLDWDDLRFFLAIARHRTLAAAARELRVTQSTVGRRLAALEASVGARLFHRAADGYALSLAGHAILANVERVEGEALHLERIVGGHDTRLAGVVRLAGSQLVTSHLVAPCLAELHARDRSVIVELLPQLSGEALVARETDIAVQMRPFEHPDLVVRKLGAIAFGLYGSHGYLERCGVPDTESGCTGHQLITLLDERELSQQAGWLSEHATRGVVVLRCDSHDTQHWATARGCGLAVLPRFRADAEPAMHRLAAHTAIPAADIWMGVHRENRDKPRVRAVLDCVAAAVRSRAAVLCPPGEDC